MSKTRLLASDREAIRNAVVAHKFDPLFAALADEEKAIGALVYERLYDKPTRTAMKRLPAGAFPTKCGVSVNCAGQRHHVDLPASAPILYKHYYGETLALPAGDTLCERIKERAAREETIKSDRAHAKKVTDATLAQFRTFDDLAVAWPEADTFIKARWQTRPDYTANVPAVVLKDLSAALDLPPEEIAEAA